MDTIQVNHPSTALHNRLHEKVTNIAIQVNYMLRMLQFPDASMIMSEDMDWISVLSSVCSTYYFSFALRPLIYRTTTSSPNQMSFANA
jgi:hypothetical protein